MKRVGPAYEATLGSKLPRWWRQPAPTWWLLLVAAVVIGAGLFLFWSALADAETPTPRFPEYRTQCDAHTGNRMYWFTGLSQVAVVNDPACPMVLVE